MLWGTGIVVRTAKRLEGPWSREELVYEPPENGAMHGFAHAELMEQEGEVLYISYVAEEIELLRVKLKRR